MLYESVSVKSQVSGSSGPLRACPKLQLPRAVRVQLYVFRRRAERPDSPKSCLQVYLARCEQRLVRACDKCVYVSLE